MILMIAAETDSVILTLDISEAADIRKSDSQGTEEAINGETYYEFGHGDDQTPAPVRVETWYTTRNDDNDPFAGGKTWYYIRNYAFGWKYISADNWEYNDFNPEDIENGIYDEENGGVLRTKKEDGKYLFVGNHTRFHIATNYNPLVQFTAPQYLTNGDSQIKVRQIQIGYGMAQYAVIPGNSSETLYDYPCSPGNYSTNQFAIFAVIEMPEEWWTLESGEYLGTAVLTLQSP